MNEIQHTSGQGEAARTSARLLLILGGARSGKSTFAQQLAAASQRTVAFIATATASDDEMRERIARHQAERPANWKTLEEPLDLAGALHRASQQADVVLLDCLTLWLSNMFLHDGAPSEEEQASMLVHERAMQALAACLTAIETLGPEKTIIMVSNEVGLGIVPMYPLGRLYRDTLGYVNQRVAQDADRVYLMVAGLAIDLKRLQEEIHW